MSLEEFAAGMARLHQRRSHGDAKPTRRPEPRAVESPRGGPPHRRPGQAGPEGHRPGFDPLSWFKAADKNHDGKLSADEAPERMKAHFKQLDKDGDGQLTPEELKQGFAAMMKHFQERAGRGEKEKK